LRRRAKSSRQKLNTTRRKKGKGFVSPLTLFVLGQKRREKEKGAASPLSHQRDRQEEKKKKGEEWRPVRVSLRPTVAPEREERGRKKKKKKGRRSRRRSCGLEQQTRGGIRKKREERLADGTLVQLGRATEGAGQKERGEGGGKKNTLFHRSSSLFDLRPGLAQRRRRGGGGRGGLTVRGCKPQSSANREGRGSR